MTTENTNSGAMGSARNSPASKSTPTLLNSQDVNSAKAEQPVDQDSGNDAESDIDGRSQAPLQKRRRVTRACDEVARQQTLASII